MLYIKSVDSKKEIIDSFYGNHSHFHAGDCGLDLYCLEDLVVPGRAYSVKIPLGICIEAGKCMYLYPRSSTGSKTPIRLSNSVGIIDSGYRGEIMAFVDNISDNPFVLKKGYRYFQLCSPDLSPIQFKVVDKLTETSRGKSGFGSTGN